MTLYLDLLDYAGFVLHGLAIVAQTVAIGSVAFLCLIAQPLVNEALVGTDKVRRDTIRILRIAGAAIAVLAVLRLGVQLTMVVGAGISLERALGAGFVAAWSLQGVAGVGLSVLAGRTGRRGVPALLVVFALGVLAGSIGTSHATGRLDDRTWLLIATALHHFGAGIWIGGLLALLFSLNTVTDKGGLALIGRRYSAIALCGVAALLIGAGCFAIKYIGSAQAMYGTAYGFMSGTKVVLFLMLIALGAANFFVVRRLNRDRSTSIAPFRRFVEVELALGLGALIAASLLTSVPPAADVRDPVSWQEIVARNWPFKPTWKSPSHDQLALSKLRNELETRGADERALAFVPGSGVRIPYNEADRLWSAFNHNWAGVFVLAGGLLALARRFGLRWAQNWPLVFLGLAVFLFLRSDADAWPMGQIGFWESFRDPEILQHRAVLPLIVGIAFFERSVQSGRLATQRAVYVFPLMCIIGGLVLLAHTHSIDDSKEVLLIEMSHSVIALLALATGSARWLELRSEDGAVKRAAAWIWPIGLALIGAALIAYREM